MTRRRSKVIEPRPPVEEELELVEDELETAPAPPPMRQLTFLSQQVHTYLGKDVVVMLDELGVEYLVDAALVDLNTKDPQDVDTRYVILPYLWQEELEALVPDLETLYRNIRRSFYRAGAFDRSALQTRARNDMFNSAFPYKHPFFAGE